MNRVLFATFLLCLPGFSSLASAAEVSKAPSAGLRVRVRLYDYAGLPGETLAKAKEVASSVFRQAGVETAWLHCPTPSQSVAGAACNVPQGFADVVVRILPREMVEKVDAFDGYYGFAWPAPEGGFATIAAVFYHQIGALARDEGYSEAILLGYLMAHEIGHLLLGLGSHSLDGLMCHPWRGEELKKAAQGTLRFNDEQCRRIIEEIQARRRRWTR